MAPSTCAQWVVEKNDGFEGLVYKDGAPIPKVGDNDVLVKIQAVSLNYRDLIIARVSHPSCPIKILVQSCSEMLEMDVII